MPATKSLIQKVTLTSDAATVTLSSIPQTYTDLLVLFSARSTRVTTGAQSVNIRFNGSTTGYSGRRLYGEASSVGSDTAGLLGVAPQDGTTANCFSSNELYIPNYTSSINKSASLTGVVEANVTDGNAGIYAVAGLWSNTSAITSIEFSVGLGNLKSGSTFYLYGVQASPNTPILTQGTQTTSSTQVIISNYNASLNYSVTTSAGTASRTGDTITVTGLSAGYAVTVSVTVSDSSGYNSSANIISNSPVEVQYLLIAGGGAGGRGQAISQSGTAGAGGGAGGYLESTVNLQYNVASAVTIGAGATTTTSQNTNGTNGSNSVFFNLTAIGGGGGGGGPSSGAKNGNSGGSGGGGTTVLSTTTGNGGSATSGQGFPGGSATASHAESKVGAGGGGAGGAGGNGSYVQGRQPSPGITGVGGSAKSSSITGSAVLRAGGGGAGDGWGAGAGGGGGAGNGGWYSGGLPVAGGAGSANTGSGGGGGYNANGGAGGSGVIILKVPDIYTATFSAGVTQTNFSSGGFKIYTLTAAGASDTVRFS